MNAFSRPAWTIISFVLACLLPAAAQDLLQPAAPSATVVDPSAPAEKSDTATKPLATPQVQDAIPAAWRSSSAGFVPAPYPGQGVTMAVSASSDAVQARVLLGFNHLHAGWEFEAGRCFAAAMQADPECLPAHWGMAMTLLSPTPETTPARQAVLLRILDLVERGVGTELERGYAYALMKFVSDGPAAGAAAFRKVSSRFPNDIQAAVFAALFSRGGFDELGQPTQDQLTAESNLESLVSKHPDSTLPLHALLFIRAEGPNPQASLAAAQKLCQQVPDYPPYLHLLGHYQWRCGHHAEAEFSFERASALYLDWMKCQQFTVADCPEWLKASTYHIAALCAQGRTTAALSAATSLAATPIPPNRMESPGSRFMLWEVQTLPARLMLDLPAGSFSAKAASSSLPPTDQTRALRKSSLAYFWIDGLRIAIETRRLIDAGEIDAATLTLNALSDHTNAMGLTRQQANLNGERSHWSRAHRGLQALTASLRGSLAQATNSPTAAEWFTAAADHQRLESLAMPPVLVAPMATRLGEELERTGKTAAAIDAYQRALTIFPAHQPTLRRLADAQRANHQPEAAAATEALLKAGHP